VAIIGINEKGMELWNSRTRAIKLLWDEITPEVDELGSLKFAEMIPINDGSELIVFGAWLHLRSV